MGRWLRKVGIGLFVAMLAVLAFAAPGVYRTVLADRAEDLEFVASNDPTNLGMADRLLGSFLDRQAVAQQADWFLECAAGVDTATYWRIAAVVSPAQAAAGLCYALRFGNDTLFESALEKLKANRNAADCQPIPELVAFPVARPRCQDAGLLLPAEWPARCARNLERIRKLAALDPALLRGVSRKFLPPDAPCLENALEVRRLAASVPHR